MATDFTLRSRGSSVWFGASVLAALVLAVAFPPAFWLCVVGGALLAASLTANSVRTGQWYSWQNEGSLSQASLWLSSHSLQCSCGHGSHSWYG